MVQDLPMTDARLSEVRKHSYEDKSLQVLMDIILHEWPTKSDDAPPLAKPYFDLREELSVQDGILIWGERTNFPKAIRLDMKQRKHYLHWRMYSPSNGVRFLAWNALQNYSTNNKLRNFSDV